LTQSVEQVDIVHNLNQIIVINRRDPASRRILTVQIEGRELKMELDSGAPFGIVSKETLHLIKPTYKLQKTDKQFVSYSGHNIKCIGFTPVNVTMGKTSRKLNLYIIEDKYDSLFDNEWISAFVNEIPFHNFFSASDGIHTITIETPGLLKEQKCRLNQFLANYEDLFSSTPGKLRGPPVAVHFKPGTTPVFACAREVPLALRDAYAKAINAKIASGFYEKVEHSEWASTTYIVMKKNGKLRITGNYKPTLNPHIVIDEYPIPRAEHLFNRMKGAKLFCHLDIMDAYTHLPVDTEFSHALTLNTPTHGLIRPTCAVYGAANIPAV